MADEIMLVVPIILGLIGVLIAVLDRGYKRFKEEQANDSNLKFGGAYLLNFLISTGASSAIIVTIVPALLSGLTDINAGTSAATAILQLVLGYTIAYTMLSKLNTSTERKLEVAAADKKLATAAGASTDDTNPHADTNLGFGKPKDDNQ